MWFSVPRAACVRCHSINLMFNQHIITSDTVNRHAVRQSQLLARVLLVEEEYCASSLETVKLCEFKIDVEQKMILAGRTAIGGREEIDMLSKLLAENVIKILISEKNRF